MVKNFHSSVLSEVAAFEHDEHPISGGVRPGVTFRMWPRKDVTRYEKSLTDYENKYKKLGFVMRAHYVTHQEGSNQTSKFALHSYSGKAEQGFRWYIVYAGDNTVYITNKSGVQLGQIGETNEIKVVATTSVSGKEKFILLPAGTYEGEPCFHIQNVYSRHYLAMEEKSFHVTFQEKLPEEPIPFCFSYEPYEKEKCIQHIFLR